METGGGKIYTKKIGERFKNEMILGEYFRKN